MAAQTITVNGNTYSVWPAESISNCDYLVQAYPGGNVPVLGVLGWVGNGTTNFDYVALDTNNENLGTFSSLTLALTALDTKIHGA